MPGPEEHSPGNSGVPLVVMGFGGLLTIVTGISIAVLAFVLVNTATGGNLAVATLALVGIVVGIAIYYAGMGELLGSGQ